jgi:protein O-mannosyl-transferase
MSKKSTTIKGATEVQRPSPVTNLWMEFVQNRIKVSIVLFIFSFVLYANTLWHEYTQDDAIVITDNMFTAQGASGIPGLFKYDTFYGFFKEEGKAALVAGGRYRPFTPAMFALEVELFGLEPFWGHLFNVMWFGICVIILYLTLFQLLIKNQPIYAGSIAAICAFLFAAHPIHTEAVANIKGRDEIMALVFSLLSLWLVLKAVDEKKVKWLIVASTVFFAGLLSKENTITFLGIIPLSLWVFRNKGLKNIFNSVLPLLVVTIVFLVVRTAVIGEFLGSEPPKELMNNPFLKLGSSGYIPFTSAEKSATITYTLGKYLQLMIFPHPLTHDYYPRQVDIMHWSDIKVIVSFLAYMIIIIWSLIRIRKAKCIYGFGILFYIMSLSIVSNILFPVGTNLSERFLFMPSIGIILVFAFWFNESLVKRGHWNWFYGLGVVILILFSFKTIDRNQVWQSNASLFLNDVTISDKSAKLQNAAGGEKIRLSSVETDVEKKRQLLDEAVVHLIKAIAIHPNYKNAYLLLGNAYYYLDEYELSIQQYANALKLDPNYKDALVNIGLSYRQAGKHYGEVLNDLPKALEYLKEALRYLPEDYESHRLTGVAYAFSNQPRMALPHFLKASELNPELPDAWRNLGNVYGQLGDTDKATEYLNKAAQMKQND